MTDQQTQELREQALAEFLSSTINFGKYRGRLWSFVLEQDPSYVIWADANIEWLSIPSEIVTQAQANNSMKKDTRELKQPYGTADWDLLDDYYHNEGFYAYDMLDDY